MMDDRTARALNAINRRFYRECASEFSATREQPWPGWGPLLQLIERELGDRELAILDVGCGNARFGAFLSDRLPSAQHFDYVGVDASAPLLERARARTLTRARATYQVVDLVEDEIDARLPRGPFSLITVFGVLHHVPGRARRRLLLRTLARRLRAGGLLALAAWQFQAFERIRRRFVPWEEYNRTSPDPIDPAGLEPGDHLLPWGEGRERVRYCHFDGEDETRRLVDELGLQRVATYRADGREGDLNRYHVLRAAAEAPCPD